MVINQPFGIGDILFIEPIYRYLTKDGERPILPVRDHLMFLAPYLPSVTMVPMSKMPADYDIDNTKIKVESYWPLRFANQIHRDLDRFDHSDAENMMADKYRLMCLDPELWKTLDIHFNEYKANQLLDELTGENWDDYILVNENCQIGRVEIKPQSSLPIIYMTERPGYTVLDWAFVMLHAQENHHVSTCTFFILQALANKYNFSGKVVMYPRPNEDGLRGISQLNPSFQWSAGK